MPTWSSLSFQNRNSPLIKHLTFFHDHAIIILITVTIAVIYLMLYNIKTNLYNRFIIEAQQIELFWTILPSIILIFIAIPSLKTLYIIEEIIIPNLTIKTIGHQWYWSYEYSDFKNIKFDTFISTNKITRLIDTSTHLIIPLKINTRILISSTDVIHSWTIPNLGVKVDATPGRINQIILIPNRPRISIGQCSEICGTNHRFIPITIETIKLNHIILKIKLNNSIDGRDIKGNGLLNHKTVKILLMKKY